MSAHGPITRHVFVHEDTLPIPDRWDSGDIIWSDDDLADLIRRTPIPAPQTRTQERNR